MLKVLPNHLGCDVFAFKSTIIEILGALLFLENFLFVLEIQAFVLGIYSITFLFMFYKSSDYIVILELLKSLRSQNKSSQKAAFGYHSSTQQLVYLILIIA